MTVIGVMGRSDAPFERRVVVIEPGCELVYGESVWRDAIVEVGAGEIELECVSGCRQTFGRGDLFWLAPVWLCAIRNPGRRRAVLVAVSRVRRLRESRGRLPSPMDRGL